MYEYELDLDYEQELIDYFNSLQDETYDYVSIEVTQIA